MSVRVAISRIIPARLDELRGRAVFIGAKYMVFRSREDVMISAPPAPPAPAPLPAPTIKRANRPTPTAAQAVTASIALITGKRVSLQVMQERTAICTPCEYARQDDRGELWCGICGCDVSMEKKRILNLAAYEERLPAWGCKHPLRSQGRGWTR